MDHSLLWTTHSSVNHVLLWTTHSYGPRTPLWTTYSCGPLTPVDHLLLWTTYSCGPLTPVDPSLLCEPRTPVDHALLWTTYSCGPLTPLWTTYCRAPRRERENWEGPGKILAKNSPLSYRVETDKRVLSTVHVQQLKAFEKPKVVRRVTSVLQGDTEEDDILHRYAEVTVEPQQLTDDQQQQLKLILDKHEQVLTKESGMTSLTTFDIDTGDASPVYQRPNSVEAECRFRNRLAFRQGLN